MLNTSCCVFSVLYYALCFRVCLQNISQGEMLLPSVHALYAWCSCCARYCEPGQWKVPPPSRQLGNLAAMCSFDQLIFDTFDILKTDILPSNTFCSKWHCESVLEWLAFIRMDLKFRLGLSRKPSLLRAGTNVSSPAGRPTIITSHQPTSPSQSPSPIITIHHHSSTIINHQHPSSTIITSHQPMTPPSVSTQSQTELSTSKRRPTSSTKTNSVFYWLVNGHV